MTSLLRQIVAGPRARHEETGLDLCYVTEDIIVTSGPSQTYPRRAYRTPLDTLVSFLDERHGDRWAIWEFRAEGTGYPDEAVYGRIRHYPWPDHHPPPFRLVPMIMASMRNWLEEGDLGVDEAEDVVAVGGKTSTGEVRKGVESGEGDVEIGQQQETIKETPGVLEALPEDTQDPIVNTDKPLQDNIRGGSKTEGTVLDKLKLKQETDPTHSPNGSADLENRRVAVVHCKAGKGRSGTVSCAYLISERGWKAEDALARFTARRMRPQFGSGISIPSQVRWISYVTRWTQAGKRYVDRAVEIVEVRIEGLRDGVQVDVCGFGEDGKRIKKLHSFTREETVLEGGEEWASEAEETKDDMSESEGSTILPVRTMSTKEIASGLLKHAAITGTKSYNIIKSRAFGTSPSPSPSQDSIPQTPTPTPADATPPESSTPTDESSIKATLRPKTPIRLATSDINISVHRRNKAPAINLTMVTSVAHVWFNTFFEGQGDELEKPRKEGVFEIDWDAMDGVKGSSRRGVRALSKLSVVWRAVEGQEVPVEQPGPKDRVPQMKPADWQGEKVEDPEPTLGLRAEGGDANAAGKTAEDSGKEEDSDFEGVKRCGPSGEDVSADEGGPTEGRKDMTKDKLT